MRLLDHPYRNKYLYTKRSATRISRTFYDPVQMIQSWSDHDTISSILESNRSPRDKPGSSGSICTTSLPKIAGLDRDIPLLSFFLVPFYSPLYDNKGMLLNIR